MKGKNRYRISLFGGEGGCFNSISTPYLVVKWLLLPEELLFPFLLILTLPGRKTTTSWSRFEIFFVAIIAFEKALRLVSVK